MWIVLKSGAVTDAFLVLGPRLATAVWSPGGPATVRLCCIYGNAAGTAEAQRETSELTRACLQDAESHGQVPALIAGDFNQTSECLGCAAELAVGGWADLHTEPTCATGSATTPRRIDLLLANKAWQMRTLSVRVCWATGLATHAVQYVELDTQAAPLVRLWKPAKVSLNATPPSPSPKPGSVSVSRWGHLSRVGLAQPRHWTPCSTAWRLTCSSTTTRAMAAPKTCWRVAVPLYGADGRRGRSAARLRRWRRRRQVAVHAAWPNW